MIQNDLQIITALYGEPQEAGVSKPDELLLR